MKIYSHPQDVRYGASEDGRIWTRNNNRWGLRENWKELKQSTDTNGYMSFKTRKNSVRTGYRVHRFMWECIVGPIGDKLVINHKDGNRANNVLSNLEVVTQSENLRLAAASSRRHDTKARRRVPPRLLDSVRAQRSPARGQRHQGVDLNCASAASTCALISAAKSAALRSPISRVGAFFACMYGITVLIASC